MHHRRSRPFFVLGIRFPPSRHPVIQHYTPASSLTSTINAHCVVARGLLAGIYVCIVQEAK